MINIRWNSLVQSLPEASDSLKAFVPNHKVFLEEQITKFSLAKKNRRGNNSGWVSVVFAEFLINEVSRSLHVSLTPLKVIIISTLPKFIYILMPSQIVYYFRVNQTSGNLKT